MLIIDWFTSLPDKEQVAMIGAYFTLLMSIISLGFNYFIRLDQKKYEKQIRKELQTREDGIRAELKSREDKIRSEQLIREDFIREEALKREDTLREKERTHKPQIEFNIDCNFYGPQGKNYILEVLLVANNKGRVRQEFKDLTLRVRGIKDNQELTFWKGREPRLCFPEALIEDKPVIPQGTEYFFAEPGEKHFFTFVTIIPETIKYILIYSTFSYLDEKGSSQSHDAERVFKVITKS
jgi:hypothetical protein